MATLTSVMLNASNQTAQTIDLTGTVTVKGGASLLKNKRAASAPTVNSDSTQDYAVGSKWMDTSTGVEYTCTDATEGAAVWAVFSPYTPSNVTITGGSINNTIIGGSTAAAGSFTTLRMSANASANASITCDANGNLTYIKNNISGSGAPTVNDDSSAGYAPMSVWYDTNGTEYYRCLSAAVGAAVWELTTLSLDDLGSMATQAASNVSITGGSINATTIGATTPAAGTFTSLDLPQAAIGGSRNISIPYFNDSNAKTILEFAGTSDHRQTFKIKMNTAQSDSAPVDVFTIGAGGNVGIGTNNPSTLLHLAKTGVDSVITTQREDGSTVKVYAAGTAGSIGTETNHPFTLFTNNTERMRINSAGNVGIGTNNPSYRVDVVDNSSGIQCRLNSSSASGTSLSFVNTATNGRSWRIGSNYVTGNGEFSVYDDTASAERLRIDSGGNVGIRTSSPAASLHVNMPDGTGTPSVRIGQSDSNPFLTFSRWTGTGQVYHWGRFIVDGYGDLCYGTSSDDATYTERMRIDSAGNIGIGVTPSSWGANYKIAEMYGGSSLWAVAAGVPAVFVSTNTYFDTAYKYKLNGKATEYYQYNGEHIWETAPSGNAGDALTFTQTMKLDASGNLGVGLSNQDSRLHVKGAGSGNDFAQLRIGYNGTAANYYDGSTHIFRGAGGINERLTIDSAGNLGLGVTPSAWGASYKAIDIAGGAALSGLNNASYLTTNAYDTADGWKYKATGYATLDLSINGEHRWYNAPSGTAGNPITFTQAMTLASTGNLGLGVIPNAWRDNQRVFEIKHASAPTGGAIDSDIAGNFGIMRNALYDATAVNWLYPANGYAQLYSFSPSGDYKWFQAGNGTAGNAITWTQAMILDANGHLGLGAAPVCRFTVMTATSNTTVAQFGGPAGTDPRGLTIKTFESNGGIDCGVEFNAAVNNNGYGAFRFSAGNAEFIRISHTGNVGIGTNAPQQLLHVKGGADTRFRLDPLSGNFIDIITNDAAGHFIDSTGAGDLTINKIGAAALIMKTSNTERLRIDAAGNLGLGVVPSAWSQGRALEAGALGNALWGVGVGQVELSQGAYFNSGWKYANSSYKPTTYEQIDGEHRWLTAPSGTAGNAITFTQAMTLNASGNLGVGTNDPVCRLDVTNTAATFLFNLTGHATNGVYMRFVKGSSTTGYIGSGNQIHGGGSSDSFGIDSASSTHLVFGAADVEGMRLTHTTRNILIGTTSEPATAARLVAVGSTADGTTNCLALYDSVGVGGTPVFSVNTDGAVTYGGYLATTQSSESNAVFYSTKSGDTDNRFAILASGELQFGSGSTARDTNLYRSTANTLKTDDNFIADGTVRGNQLLASNTNGLTLYDDVADGYLSYGYNSGRSNTAGHRFYNGITTETARISSTGVLTFGADLDTNLYRSAANTLKTDDSFLAAGDMGCGSDKAFYFGDTGTEGSWRIIRDGNNLVMQRRESSVWTTKQTISA